MLRKVAGIMRRLALALFGSSYNVRGDVRVNSSHAFTHSCMEPILNRTMNYTTSATQNAMKVRAVAISRRRFKCTNDCIISPQGGRAVILFNHARLLHKNRNGRFFHCVASRHSAVSLLVDSISQFESHRTALRSPSRTSMACHCQKQPSVSA